MKDISRNTGKEKIFRYGKFDGDLKCDTEGFLKIRNMCTEQFQLQRSEIWRFNSVHMQKFTRL